LVLAGSGPETAALQSLANLHDPRGRLIRLVGQLSDGELQWYLRRAGGAIFPQEEDFGIAIMEAQLAGCPVIVNPRSGAAELLTIETAIFLSGTSTADAVRSLRRLRRKTWRRLDIVRQARQYAGAYFARQWRARLKALEGKK
jgi:glycosyltransferase involved in cell wall biosynthesis